MYTSDLIRIALAGGSLRVNCEGKFTSDLVRIASAVKEGGGVLILENLQGKFVGDLVRIAEAAPGKVIFSEPR